MEFRKALVSVLGALAILVGVLPKEAAAAEKPLLIGTLAPQQSIWGGVFDIWAKAVCQKTGGTPEECAKNSGSGKLALQFFYNGQQGDEGAMVGKMKAGQLDGAAITAVGLSKIYKPILALQLPGALTTWDKLGTAQEQLHGDFEKGLKDAGFDLLGWGNVGQAHFFTSGKDQVHAPDDLKSRKPYMWRDDIISPVFYTVVGATPVPLNVPEVLPQLKTGTVNALNAPSLAVEQLQWGGELTAVGADPTGCAIGAIVMSSSRIAGLPGDLRTILLDTGVKASKALGKKVVDEDTAAFGRLSGKLKVVTYTDDQKAKWKAAFAATRKRLAQGTFSPELIAKIEKIGGV